MQRCWDRTKWRDKKEINRVLRLREKDLAQKHMSFTNVSSMFQESGAIYAIYHFTSGRWYVGQTVSTIDKRAQGHWWGRFRDSDAFHQALGLEESPFCFIALP